MKLFRKTACFSSGVLATLCLCASVSNAQAGSRGSTSAPVSNTLTTVDGNQANTEITEKYLRQELGDPKEEAAYQAFHKVGADQPDKKIKLGEAFLAKYPKDRYSQAVYEELAQTYYAKKDLTSFYVYSDKGIAAFPDDVHLLALTSWVIPRAFDHNDPDADKRLDKAETYAKHAIEVVSTMPKPDTATDQQFADYKKGELAVAHSGLGLIYFRREQYDTSAKELQEATAAEAKPDPTDFFVLGADLENEGRFKEAVDAFNNCAQLGGSMQDNCKQQATNAVKLVGNTK
jgi:tetratricopeptide (TPR) repeat protein